MNSNQRFARFFAIVIIVMISSRLDTRTDWFWESWQSFLWLTGTIVVACLAVLAIDKYFQSTSGTK